MSSSQSAVELGRNSRSYAVVGCTHDAKTWNSEVEQAIRELASHSKVVALGEMGLDYYYDHSPREIQQEVFRAQLALARSVSSAVIHSREAAQDTLNILKEFRDVPRSCTAILVAGRWLRNTSRWAITSPLEEP